MCKPYLIGLFALLNDRVKIRKDMDTELSRDNVSIPL